MPTFTAIALDRLIEPGAHKSIEKPVPSGKLAKPPIAKLERRIDKPAKERTFTRPQISPALYATPEAIPLPDSPSSFPPSPYIINHKGRGQRLLKSFSEVDISSRKKTANEGDASDATVNAGTNDTKPANIKKSTSLTFSTPEPIKEEQVNGVCGGSSRKDQIDSATADRLKVGQSNGIHDGELKSKRVELEQGSSNRELGNNNRGDGQEQENAISKYTAVSSERDVEPEDFYDPNESMSFTTITELEDAFGSESSKTLVTPGGEFYDAWEELSSDGGIQMSLHDTEAELREMRLGLLTEIEKRKQAEEALHHMRTHWQRVRQQLAQVGVTLPADPTDLQDGEQADANLAEELRLQFDIARFVSASVGRGIIKADLTMEMESRIESKNFEIARLSDRLHYYEAVNREMSQRNQEAVEMARRDRQRKKRRQRWVWGSIAVAITLGSAALAWSYFPSGKAASSSGDNSQPPESDDTSSCGGSEQ